MPEYVLKCKECGKITEVTCSYEALNNPRLFCMRYNVKKDGMCGGKFTVQIGRFYHRNKDKTIVVD